MINIILEGIICALSAAATACIADKVMTHINSGRSLKKSFERDAQNKYKCQQEFTNQSSTCVDYENYLKNVHQILSEEKPYSRINVKLIKKEDIKCITHQKLKNH